MLVKFFPIIIVIFSNTFYHISSKSTPQNANPFASLFVTYTVAAIVTFILLLFNTNFKSPFINTFQQLNWTSFILGIAIIGLEFGYIQAYRIGWNVSICSLVCNLCLAVILLLVGILIYGEQVAKQQFLGILFCLVGIFLINKK